MLAVGSLVPLLQVAEIATFPGEWLDNKLWVEKKINPGHVAASLRALLIEGDVDGAARKPKSVWSNRLVLPGFDAIDHAKFDSEAKFDAVSKPYRFVPVISKGRC